MQTFLGHALGKVRGGRKGGSIWLFESDFNKTEVQSRLKDGVFVLLKVVPPLEVEKPVQIEEEPPVIASETIIEEVVVLEEVQAEEPEEQETPPGEGSVYSEMKTSELRDLLKEMGLYDPSLRKKADMLKVLEEHHEN